MTTRVTNSRPSAICGFVGSSALIIASLALFDGCGTTTTKTATEQLLISDAVDQAISQVDFTHITGEKVFVDTTYLETIKGVGFVNSAYIISSLRHHLTAARCLIQDTREAADVILEPRVGALGTDGHEVVYGLPQSSSVAFAATMLSSTPVPAVPEVSIGKRNAQSGIAKVIVFAYDRETRAPIWQSGVNHSLATAKNTWVMGVGPFQGGTIREQTKLAGSAIRIGPRSATGSPARFFDRPPVDYTAETRFQNGWPVFDDGGLSTDMIGIPDAELHPPEVAETNDEREPGTEMVDVEVLPEPEIAERPDASGDSPEIANAQEEPNLQR